jgi:SWI/SNF chromatin-remodeling complex subunit SWI1
MADQAFNGQFWDAQGPSDMGLFNNNNNYGGNNTNGDISNNNTNMSNSNNAGVDNANAEQIQTQQMFEQLQVQQQHKQYQLQQIQLQNQTHGRQQPLPKTFHSRKNSLSSQHSQIQSQAGTPAIQYNEAHNIGANANPNLGQSMSPQTQGNPNIAQNVPLGQVKSQMGGNGNGNANGGTSGSPLNPQNTEKFLDLVEQYMKKINKPFVRYPVVGGVKINLFILYYMVTYVGGFIKGFQEHRFGNIAAQLGIPANNQKVFNEFLQCYYTNLLPFEQYAKTVDQMKDPQRRAMAQSQAQAQAQPNAQQIQGHATPMQQTPVPASPMQGDAQPHAFIHAQEQSRAIQVQARAKAQEVARVQAAQAAEQQKLRIQQMEMQEKMDVQKKLMQQKQQKMIHPPQIPPQHAQPSPPLLQGSKISKPKIERSRVPSAIDPLTVPANATVKKALTPKKLSYTDDPTIIKEYMPFTVIQDKPEGVDIANIERIGEQLDDMKPVFLYFPELGKIDIKALSLSLSSGITAEINVALNVLLIVSSDPNIKIPFESCKILLNSLSTLGIKIIKKLAIKDYELNEGKHSFSQDDIESDAPKSRLDEVFEKYAKQYEGADYTIQVDSFTSQLVSTSAAANSDSHQIISIEGTVSGSSKTGIPVLTNSTLPDVNKDSQFYSSTFGDASFKFNIPTYLDMLHECRAQADDIDFNIYGKSYLNKRIVLVEELGTISLIFRNLSFVSNNNLELARNEKFQDYIFSMLYSTILNPEIFSFRRKRLSFMKDSLIILTNIAHAMDVRTEMEMWLLLSLVAAFSPQMAGSDNKSKIMTSKVTPDIDRYHAHSVDVLTKLLCSSSLNKRMIEKLLTGDSIEDKGVLDMITLNYGNEFAVDGSFFKSVFINVMSIVPTHMMYQGLEPFNILYQSNLEAIIACIVLCEMLERVAGFTSNIALELITSEERFVSILQHLSFIYAAVYMNIKDNTKEKHSLFSVRCATLANKLLRIAIDVAELNEDTANENIAKLKYITRLFGNEDNQISMLMTPNIPGDILEQVIESIKLSDEVDRYN